MYFTGFTLHVISVLYVSLWFLFVFHLFARSVDTNESWIVNDRQHTGKIHAIEVTTVLSLTLIVPIITITALDGYNIRKLFSSHLVLSYQRNIFHSVILPCLIIPAIGLSLIFITFLKIHRVSLLLLYNNTI